MEVFDMKTCSGKAWTKEEQHIILVERQATMKDDTTMHACPTHWLYRYQQEGQSLQVAPRDDIASQKEKGEEWK